MTTVAEILNLALLDAGVAAQGQVPSGADTNNALRRLNMLLQQWAIRRWLVYHLIDVSHVMTGAESYSVGAGGDIDTTRPDSVEAAYLRQLSPSTTTPIDYPLQIIMSREDYSQIRLKNLKAAPSSALFYDSGWPLGYVYPYPIPDSRFELHLILKQPLQVIANAQDTLVFPPGYEEAIYANLVVRLCAAYKLPLAPGMAGIAKASLETIRTSNGQVPTMNMPGLLQNRSGYGYSIFSDGWS